MKMTIDFNKFNKEFGGQQALDELAKAQENQFVEVPDDDYLCELESLELGESKKGQPMIKGVFRIKEGQYKKQCLFLNQVFTPGFPQYKGLEFLKSLNVFEDADITFNGDFKEFNDLLLDISEASQSLLFLVNKVKDGDYARLTVKNTY